MKPIHTTIALLALAIAGTTTTANAQDPLPSWDDGAESKIGAFSDALLAEAKKNGWDDALRRERFLETGKGKRYIKSRLTRYLGARHNKLERH